MDEHTIKELMTPIAAYIQSNKVSINDVHIVVQTFLPDEDRLRQIATYLQQHIQSFKVLEDDKLYERTRQILTHALNNAALDVLNDKEGYNESDELEDIVSYSDLDEDDFGDLEEDCDDDWNDYEEDYT